MFKSYLLLTVVALVTSAAILAAGRRSYDHGQVEVESNIPVKPAAPTLPSATVKELKTRRDYHAYLWKNCDIKGSQVFRIDKALSMYLENKKRYKGIEKMRRGGVPAAIVFVLHGRESTWNFNKHLHEGSYLTSRTKWVPKGRPKAPPRNGSVYTFEESAEDALYKLKDLESINWKDCNTALYNIEKYNGLGYLKYRPIHSPYMWSGTNHYYSGKYVADGKYSSTAIDRQLGTCAILKRMTQRNIDIGFE